MSKDLHLRLIDPAQQRALGNFTLGFGAPVRVEGIQKLANQWLMLFLTPKGSHPWRQTEGTNFPYLLTNNVVDLGSMQTAVLEYIEDATAQLKRIQQLRQGVPADEALNTVNLTRFTQIDANSFDIWVRVINSSRSTLSVLIPYARFR
jgi:hypothetical protein